MDRRHVHGHFGAGPRGRGHEGPEVPAPPPGACCTSYAESLQRPDGIFIHALEGPHAWGRGNGFALLGVTEALAYLPDTWPDRAGVLEIYRKHLRALVTYRPTTAAGGRSWTSPPAIAS